MTSQEISPAFPYQSNYVEVLGSKMHYIEEGEGDPILFLHGNPTSSYLWRNVIPHLSKQGRCIAPDLIGMGKSDKPDLKYRFFEHAKYLDGFIEKLGLKNITLVIHDWGSGLGLHYARRHASNIKAVAMMESILRTVNWSDFPPDFKMGFKLMRAPGIGFMMISVLNSFVEKILPQATHRKLGQAEMDYYRAPYPTIKSRQPVRQWPCEIPIEGSPADTYDAVSAYVQWLQETELPKLLLYAHPGGLVTEDLVKWCEDKLPNLKTVDIGPGLHFVQETNPHGIGHALSAWHKELFPEAAKEKVPG